jgi:hypothetical protein
MSSNLDVCVDDVFSDSNTCLALRIQVGFTTSMADLLEVLLIQKELFEERPFHVSGSCGAGFRGGPGPRTELAARDPLFLSCRPAAGRSGVKVSRLGVSSSRARFFHTVLSVSSSIAPSHTPHPDLRTAGSRQFHSLTSITPFRKHDGHTTAQQGRSGR